MSLNPILRKNDLGFLLSIKAQPRSSASRVEGIEGEHLKIRLQAPAHDSRANQALIGLLKKTLRLPKSRLSIVQGEKSRYKVLQLATELSEPEILQILGIE